MKIIDTQMKTIVGLTYENLYSAHFAVFAYRQKMRADMFHRRKIIFPIA